MFPICFLFTFKHQDYRVLFCKVTPEKILMHFYTFLTYYYFWLNTLIIEYCVKRKKMKQLRISLLKPWILNWLSFYLAEREHVCTLRQYYLICLYIKWYILCFKLLFCTTLKSNRGENLNRIYMYVDSTNRLGTFAKLSYPGSGRQTFCR